MWQRTAQITVQSTTQYDPFFIQSQHGVLCVEEKPQNMDEIASFHTYTHKASVTDRKGAEHQVKIATPFQTSSPC